MQGSGGAEQEWGRRLGEAIRARLQLGMYDLGFIRRDVVMWLARHVIQPLVIVRLVYGVQAIALLESVLVFPCISLALFSLNCSFCSVAYYDCFSYSHIYIYIPKPTINNMHMTTLSPNRLPSPSSTDSDGSRSPKSSVDTLAALIKTVYRTSDINFFVNGRPVMVKNPNPDWVLLDWIRLQDGLKGTKLGCGEGGCGACTVVIQTTEPSRQVNNLAVNACLYPLIGVDGKSLITIEGLGTANRPHPLQERIARMQ